MKNNLSQKFTVPSLFILVLMISVGPFGDTLYTPSMPIIAQSLQASYQDVQLTITFYLLGYAMGQLFFGPFSDRFGRRPIMCFGASAFVLGSFLCFISYNISYLIIGRLIQGMGACAGAVISSACVKDAFEVREQGKIFAQMNIAFSIAPGAGPIIGSLIGQYLNWHYNFLLLLIISIILLLCVYLALPETLKEKNHSALHPAHFIKNYYSLFTKPGYAIYLLILGINLGIVYACLVEAPGLLLNIMHLTPKWFIIVALSFMIGFMIGSLLCSQLCKFFKNNTILLFGLLIELLSSITLWVLMYLGHVNIIAFIGPCILIFIGVAFNVPIATAEALAPFGRIAGSASAMMGFCQMGIASLITAIITFLNFGHVFNMPISFTAISSFGLLVLSIYLLTHKKSYKN